MLAPFLALLLALTAPASQEAFEELWSAPLGQGFSSLAVEGERGFVSHREPGASLTLVRAVELVSGATVWEHGFDDAGREGQEDYGGGRGPHATPLVHAGAVFVLGYAGRLVALDAASGAERWSLDLVQDLGARPVQFGFAAGPVALDGRVFVMTGGEGGVAAFGADGGEVLWHSPPRAASYVTPVLARFEGELQLVCLFETATVGLDPLSGEELWSVPHLRPGETNYARLIVLEDGGLVVSGQGSRGARRIDVTRDGERWRAQPRWHARAVQFSHGRVLERDGFLYGCNGSVLCALAARDGTLAFKLRGFAEANLVDAGELTLCLDEEGRLALLELAPARIDVRARRELLEPKAWATPTRVGERVFLRDARRLVAVRLSAPADLGPALETLETGYTPGAVVLPPALIAFAHGTYVSAAGEVFRLEAEDGALSLRLPGADAARALSPRSETRFAAGEDGTLELVVGEGPVPTALRWTSAGVTTEAALRPFEPRELDSEALARVLGPWRVAGEVELELVQREGRLEATSSADEGVIFRVRAESGTRLWLEAVDAPYGIPVILLEVGEERLRAHQASDTYDGVRR